MDDLTKVVTEGTDIAENSSQLDEFDAILKISKEDEEQPDSEQQEDLEAIEAAYEAFAAECEAALRLTLDRIKNLSDAFNRSKRRNPFDRIESRIKTFKSVRGKCEKRGIPFTSKGIREHIKDIAGIRIITKYIDEIDCVKKLIEKLPGINVVISKDYVTKPKENGYSSMHLGCQVEIYDPFFGSRLIPVEIQLRTKAMNLWATLEHDLKYKNPNPSPEVYEKFCQISAYLRDVDREAVELRDYNEADSKKPK